MCCSVLCINESWHALCINETWQTKRILWLIYAQSINKSRLINKSCHACVLSINEWRHALCCIRLRFMRVPWLIDTSNMTPTWRVTWLQHSERFIFVFWKLVWDLGPVSFFLMMCRFYVLWLFVLTIKKDAIVIGSPPQISHWRLCLFKVNRKEFSRRPWLLHKSHEITKTVTNHSATWQSWTVMRHSWGTLKQVTLI